MSEVLLESLEAIIVQEHLLMRDRAKIVDPLISRLKKATLRMFRTQKKHILASVTPVLGRMVEAEKKSVPPMLWAAVTTGLSMANNAAWIKARQRARSSAFDGAASLVAKSLDADLPEGVVLADETAASISAADRLAKTTMDRLRTALEDALTKSEYIRSRPTVSDDEGSEGAPTKGDDALEDTVTKSDDVEDAIASVLDDPDRAETVALSEIADAFGSGQSAAAEAISMDTGDDILKEWVTEPDACEICIENEDAGRIDIDDPFPSGDDDPPAHPNCRCSLEMHRASELSSDQ